MNSDSQIGSLNLANFFNQLTGGAAGKDISLSSTSPFTDAKPQSKSGLFGDNTLKYILIAVALYAAYMYFNKRGSRRSQEDMEDDSRHRKSSSQSQSQSQSEQSKHMSNLSQYQSEHMSNLSQSQSQSQSEEFLFELNTSDSDFRALKREFAPEVHLSKEHMTKVMHKLKKMHLSKPAHEFIRKLKSHLAENAADIDHNVIKLYALVVLMVHKISKCEDVDKLNKMSKVIDHVTKNKLEHLGVKKSDLMDIISKRVEHLNNKRQYHNLMTKLTTHAKFVSSSHDLTVLVDFLRDNANDVDALKKMSKYINDLKTSDFEKKFVNGVAITKDDLKYVLNSRINQKEDSKSENLMKKLKALVHMHSDTNIKVIRHLYRELKDRDVKLSTLSANVKDIDGMTNSKFEDKFTDAINFDQSAIVKAINHKVARIEKLRSVSSKSR